MGTHFRRKERIKCHSYVGFQECFLWIFCPVSHKQTGKTVRRINKLLMIVTFLLFTTAMARAFLFIIRIFAAKKHVLL